MRAQLEAINQRTQAQKVFAASLAEQNGEIEAAMSKLPPTLAALGKELPNQLPKLKEWAAVLHDLTQAQEGQNKSLARGTAFVAQNAAGILQSLWLKREYAATMAIYEMAEGFAALGDFGLLGGGKSFVSAGYYAKVAGTGSHSGSGGSGSSGRRMRSSRRDSGWGSGGGSGQGVERAGSPSGGTGIGEGDRGGNTVVTIPGNMSTQGQQQMAAWLGIGAGAGTQDQLEQLQRRAGAVILTLVPHGPLKVSLAWHLRHIRQACLCLSVASCDTNSGPSAARHEFCPRGDTNSGPLRSVPFRPYLGWSIIRRRKVTPMPAFRVGRYPRGRFPGGIRIKCRCHYAASLRKVGCSLPAAVAAGVLR